jgi:DHA1 family bicyclomycin/chloramphenicol resistance-like MFS transporter
MTSYSNMQMNNSLTNSAAGPSECRTAALLSMLAAFAALALDLYLPALPAIGAGLVAAPNAVQLSVTVFLAGFMLGMLFCGPLSDSLGRRKMLLSGIVLFALASVACMLATSIEQLIVARFLQALGGGTASLLARVVARDLFPGPGAIRMLSLIAMVSAIAPLVAPMAGSVVMMAFGWRGTFGALLAWALFSLLAVWNLLPESLPPEHRVSIPLARMFGVYGVLLGDRALAWLLLSGGMSFAAMFVYITAGPFFFIQLHGFTSTQYSVVFAANALGIFGANYLNRRCAIHPGPEAMMLAGCALALAGALGLLGAVLGQANTTPALCGLFLVVSMTGLLGANAVGLLMARYPRDAGAAAALFGAAQFGFGTIASVAVSLLHDGSGRPMAWVIVISCAVSLLGQLMFRHAAQPTHD